MSQELEGLPVDAEDAQAQLDSVEFWREMANQYLELVETLHRRNLELRDQVRDLERALADRIVDAGEVRIVPSAVHDAQEIGCRVVLTRWELMTTPPELLAEVWSSRMSRAISDEVRGLQQKVTPPGVEVDAPSS